MLVGGLVWEGGEVGVVRDDADVAGHARKIGLVGMGTVSEIEYGGCGCFVQELVSSDTL